nr:TPA_asm: penton [Powellomyces chytrid fungus MELD virus 5]
MYNEYTYCSLKNRSFSIPSKRIESMKILSVSFLQDWDLVSPANNTVNFVESGSSDVLSAKIRNGNYTVADFPDAMASAMNAVGSQSYSVSYDGVTRRLTVSTSGSKDFKVLPGSRGTTSYILTGMSRWSETGYGKSFTMKNNLNLSSSYPVLLVSNIPVRGARYLSDFNDAAQSVVSTIIPDSFGDIVTHSNEGEFMAVGETISKIEFYLIDSFTGNEVSLNSPLTVRFGFTDDSDDSQFA